MSSLEGFPL